MSESRNSTGNESNDIGRCARLLTMMSLVLMFTLARTVASLYHQTVKGFRACLMLLLTLRRCEKLFGAFDGIYNVTGS